MKFATLILSFIIILFSGVFLQAQNTENLKPEEIAEKQLEELDKEINLDDFQKLELNDYLIENAQKIKSGIEEGMKENEMRFFIENNSREFNAKLKEVLLPEQYDKYTQLQREKAMTGEINNKKKKSKKPRK